VSSAASTAARTFCGRTHRVTARLAGTLVHASRKRRFGRRRVVGFRAHCRMQRAKQPLFVSLFRRCSSARDTCVCRRTQRSRHSAAWIASVHDPHVCRLGVQCCPQLFALFLFSTLPLPLYTTALPARHNWHHRSTLWSAWNACMPVSGFWPVGLAWHHLHQTTAFKLFIAACRENVNLVMKYSGKNPYVLTSIVIAAPSRGFTAPVGQGLVFCTWGTPTLHGS
jgi:hypothetical protein